MTAGAFFAKHAHEAGKGYEPRPSSAQVYTPGMPAIQEMHEPYYNNETVAHLPSLDTPLGLQHGESFILLFMFYEVLNENIGTWNVLSRLVSLYERLSGKQKHRHVGISLGIRKNNKQILVLPYDLSCWNSRLSGISYISSHREDTRPTANYISASDAVYVDIHVTIFDQILQNFKVNSDAFVWNRLPRKGIKYPTLRTIIRDHVLYTLHYCRKAVDLQQIDIELEKINNEAQCAQYVLMLLIYLLRAQQIPNATSGHMNSIYSLVYRKTSLHPHTLWGALLATNVFKVVEEKCSVLTLQQFTHCSRNYGAIGKLTDIKMDNPFDARVPLNEILVYECKHTHQFAT
jgi:hypothetical protein